MISAAIQIGGSGSWYLLRNSSMNCSGAPPVMHSSSLRRSRRNAGADEYRVSSRYPMGP